MDYQLSLYFMAGLYLLAGVAHFVVPGIFLQIMPPWVPSPKLVNKLVGVAEILLGLLLLYPRTQQLAAWLIIALLVAVFPANIRHFNLARKSGRGVLLATLRLPLQVPLVYWAWLYT